MSLGVRGLERRDEDVSSGQSVQTPSGGSMRSAGSTNLYAEPRTIKIDEADEDLRSFAPRRSLTEKQTFSNAPGIVRSHEIDADGSATLPPGKGFPIQIGSELFRLSGASIMSDAPSYFSRFFDEQLKQNDDAAGGVRTLYIDRDPSTFQDICLHLRGYHVKPRDGSHYVRMFADAQFYSLPRLVAQLFDSEIFIQIGSAHYQIPRDIFSSPGNTPNFFSLGFAAFFSSPDEVFPGLDRQGLLRPPSILPPTVPNRSATVFAELIHLLQGYPLHIRDNDHRTDLLRDCRYFHLRGLEQKLIMHDISYNSERNKSEIILRLEDIRQSGVSFAGDVSPSDRSPLGGWVNYVRPFVDEKASELIIEIGDESNKLDFRNMRADFYGHAKARISSLFQVVANKMNLPTEVPLGLMMAAGGANAQPASPGNTPLSKDRVRFRIERDCHVILDGEDWSIDTDEIDYQAGSTHPQGAFLEVSQQAGSTPLSASQSPSQTGGWPLPGANDPSPRKRKRRGSLEEFGEWIVRKGQWRLRVQPRLDQRKDGMEIVLHAVKLDAVSGQRGRNMMRSFLN